MRDRFDSSFKLVATVLAAAAMVAACGGGGSASGPADTTPPTVTITDNISATTADGNVTFTFTFSEAITGFVSDDITLTGGTKGTFTMAANNLSATLVAIPNANTIGTLSVSVAAGNFTDTAGNANAAASSASQAYDTSNLLINGSFDNGTTGWTGNARDVRTENGNSYNFANVATARDPWDANLSQAVNIPASGVRYKLIFKASSDRPRTLIAGIGLSGAPYTSTTQSVNLTTTVQTFELSLTSNFADANSRVLFDMGAAVGIVVIDDVKLVLDTTVVGPTTAAPAPTMSAANVKSIFSDSYTNITVNEWGPDWGPFSARITDASISGNNHKAINMAADQTFTGISFTSSKFDATTYTTFHMDYWIDAPLLAGQVLNIKLSNHDGNSETSAIEHTVTVPVTGGWQRLAVPLNSFTQASNSTSRNNIAQVVIAAARTNTAQPVVIYFDNLYFSR